MRLRAGDSARLMRIRMRSIRILNKTLGGTVLPSFSALIQRDCLAFKAHICATL